MTDRFDNLDATVDRLFEGRAAPLVAHFSEAGGLSKDDVAALRRLLEEIEDDR